MIERAARPLRGFANGLANVVKAIFGALGTPGRFLQDFLNGTWLAHSLQAVLVDVVIGAATAALLLDLLRTFFAVDGLEVAATWVVGLAYLACVGSILTGLTDTKDTSPDSATRDVSVLHGVINILATGTFFFSLMRRLDDDHGTAFVALLVGYLLISLGGYIGGHIVFKHGYAVNANAFAKGKRAAEFTAVLPVADLPEDTPTKASLGATSVVLVRRGDVVHALKDSCSHAGGPLSQGSLHGDAIECPWHGSQFRLADGTVKHGPATSRQVAYRARVRDGQVELQGPVD